MNLSPNDKIAGVLAPLFALRTEDDLGIGDVAALRQFIDWARGIGFKLVQLLPINETGGDNSPYNAISSRAIDPTTLHLAPGAPEDLSEEDFAEVTARDRPLGAAPRHREIQDRQAAEEEIARSAPSPLSAHVPKSIRRSRQRLPHFAKRKNPGLSITPCFEC